MFKSLLALVLWTVLGLLVFSTSKAETVCRDCEYTYNGRYLGDYWIRDNATFANREIPDEIGGSTGFDNYWVFDLNTNGAVAITIDTKASLVQPFSVEIYLDAGSTCTPTRCSIALPDFNNPIVSKSAATKWTAKVALPAGRYLIRVAAETRPLGSGGGRYLGTLAVTKR